MFFNEPAYVAMNRTAYRTRGECVCLQTGQEFSRSTSYTTIQLCTEMKLIIQLHEMLTNLGEIPLYLGDVQWCIMQLMLIRMALASIIL